jgi:hypothetical protein
MAHDLLLGKTRRDWSCGSMLLPASQQKAIFNKIDDVRYDIRRVGNRTSVGMLTISAAVSALALASIYRTHKGI